MGPARPSWVQAAVLRLRVGPQARLSAGANESRHLHSLSGVSRQSCYCGLPAEAPPMIRGSARKRTWDDSLSDGCSGIDGLLILTGGERPPELRAACIQHDRDYYERVKSRRQADQDFLKAMTSAANSVADAARRQNLLRRARLRYAVVRAVGWWWWIT